MCEEHINIECGSDLREAEIFTPLAGATAHAVNTSVLATLEKQHLGADFFDVLLPLLEKCRSEL